MRLVVMICIAALLGGCVSNSSHFYRNKGEQYKFYPFEEGYALEVAKQGRACWAESNRENWDQCQ